MPRGWIAVDKAIRVIKNTGLSEREYRLKRKRV
jgi:hypothetical protein